MKKFEEGHCPECGAKRADIMVEYLDRYSDDVVDAWTYYYVMECRGCGYLYFKRKHSNSEDIDYIPDEYGEVQVVANETVNYWPPSAKRRKPDWFDDIEDRTLSSLFSDTYVALGNNLHVLAAIGMRTTFDRASELLNVDPAASFAEKLLELKNGEHISEKERKHLEVLIDAGSAAAHRGWRPKPDYLDAMMNILESFLHRAFVLDEATEALAKNVPAKPTRKSKAP